jgi:hypothetical protein
MQQKVLKEKQQKYFMLVVKNNCRNETIQKVLLSCRKSCMVGMKGGGAAVGDGYWVDMI